MEILIELCLIIGGILTGKFIVKYLKGDYDN